MPRYSPEAIIDLVEEALANDQAISEETAEMFLGIFTSAEQVLLMERALQVVTPFTQEARPCLPLIAPSTTP